MIYHCPKCGAVCKSLFFDRRNKIIFCDVCRSQITEMKLEEENNGKEEERDRRRSTSQMDI